MILPALALPTDTVQFDDWLRYLLYERAPNVALDARSYGQNKHRYELTIGEQPVLELDVLPLSKERIEVRSAALSPGGINIYDILYQRAREAYGAEMPRWSIMNAVIRYQAGMAVNPEHSELTPDQAATRHQLADMSGRRLPPIPLAEAAPLKRGKGRRRNPMYDEGLRLVTSGYTMQEAYEEIRHRYDQTAGNVTLNEFSSAVYYRLRQQENRK